MDKDQFAKAFGFFDYQEMLDHSTTVIQDKDTSWYVSKLPHGKYLAWDNAEIADDRVEVFFSKEDAADYLHILQNMSDRQ
jgi:hypothetical protein